jgi:lipoate-protein ligase B
VASPELWTVSLGTVPYADALALQRDVARRRISGEIPEDVLLLVEHPPVVTLGRSARGRHLTASPALLAARGVELFEVERGGDVTFHGPGQLVGYPIVDLKRHRRDLHWYLRQVEEVLIRAVGRFGIDAGRREGYTGVWVGTAGNGDSGLGTVSSTPDSRFPSPDDAPFPVPPSPFPVRKLASIGVHARDWVTWHGFALNVSTRLDYFDLMVPCGIPDVVMTSIERETPGSGVTVGDAARSVVAAMAEVFALVPRETHTSALAAEPVGAE